MYKRTGAYFALTLNKWRYVAKVTFQMYYGRLAFDYYELSVVAKHLHVIYTS